MAQIFISHSKEDNRLKSFFERAFAGTKVRAVFVEYERYEPPAAAFIQRQINESKAMFLLLGKNVEKLSHTKIWVGSEAGVAQQANRDIWVFEPNQDGGDVPVPFVSHYVPFVESDQALQYLKEIINSYDDSAALEAFVRGGGLGAAAGAVLSQEKDKGGAALIGALVGGVFETVRTDPARARPVGLPVTCGSLTCRSTFRVHGVPDVFRCPVCRGWLRVNWDLKPGVQLS